MNLVVLTPEKWSALRSRLDAYIPEDEATEEFWSRITAAEEALTGHLSRFGSQDEAWEIPWHSQRCRVIYAYLYAESLYTPDLLPGVAAAIPADGHAWCAELECYTDADRQPNGIPLLLGVLAIHNGTAYASADDDSLIAYAPRLQI